MSLSFPASPTNGQQYQNWTWNSSIGAWVPNYAAGFVTSFGGRAGAVTLQPADNTSGQKILLSSQTVTTPVASVQYFKDFTVPPLYDQLEVEMIDVGMSADSGMYYSQSTDGSTFDVSSNYNNNYLIAYGSSVSNAANTSGPTNFLMSSIIAGGMTIGGQNIRAWTRKPWLNNSIKWWGIHALTWGTAAAPYPQYFGYCSFGGTPGQLPIKGMRFQGSGANIIQGTFNIYGIVR